MLWRTFRLQPCFLLLTSYDTDEYDALLYYLDNEKRQYIYYRYSEDCFICGSEPNINSKGVYYIKKWDEIIDKEFHKVNKEYIIYNKMLSEASEWIDESKHLDKDEKKNQKNELNKYKNGIDNENLSNKEINNFMKLYKQIANKKNKENKLTLNFQRFLRLNK